MIGEGSFGRVWGALLQQDKLDNYPSIVAVKTLKGNLSFALLLKSICLIFIFLIPYLEGFTDDEVRTLVIN